MQGFQYFSSVPVLHHLQAILFFFNLNNLHEYLIQRSLKLGGTNYHFKRVKVPGTSPLLKSLTMYYYKQNPFVVA